MDSKRKIDPTDTAVLDDDVMDEMEDYEATAVLDNRQAHLSDADILDDELLDDIEASTVVLDNKLSQRKD